MSEVEETMSVVGYDLYMHKECGCMQTRPRNFCHNCGAEMEAGE